jgi:uncharacterized protein YndB with AHSA1/START domain
VQMKSAWPGTELLTQTVIAVVAALGVLWMLWVASPALAASTVSVSLGAATPEQDIPLSIAYSGTTDSSSSGNPSVLSVARPGGAQPCANTYANDLSAAGGADYIITNGSRSPGTFSFSGTYNPAEPGSYLICTWIEDGNNNPIAGPVSTPFMARGPQVTVFSVGLPVAPVRNRPFQITYTTQTDQQLQLSSIIKPAGGSPCAASFNLELQENENSRTTLLSGTSVYGGPTATSVSATEASGSYVICSWIEGPDSAEIDQAITTPVTVPAPPAQPAVARLRIIHATASRKHGVTIVGTTVPGLTGRIVIYATCGKKSVSSSPPARNGTFSGHVRLPGTCRRASSVKIGAVWAGSPAFAKQAVAEQVAIKR